MYRNVRTPIQGSPNDAAQSRKDGVPPLLVNLHILFTLATSETTRPHGAQQNCMQLGGSTDPPHPFHEGTSTLVTLVMAVYSEDSVCAHVCAGTQSQMCVYVFVEVPGQLQVSSSRHRPL